jgi:thiosulfate reductase cytochrome b subunit
MVSAASSCPSSAGEKIVTNRKYLISPWIRIWHWTNAVLVLALGVTGMSVHFADPNLPLVEFSLAVRIHNIAGVALVAAYVIFVIANIVSGNWWHFVPKPPGIAKRILVQAKWYAFGMFRGEPHPHEPSEDEHFNALQAVTYWNVMYLLMPVILVTGLIYLYPEFAPDKIFGFDGLLPIALLHYLSASAVLLFLLSHIYLGTTGKTVGQMFKMMLTGWHEH